MPTVGVRFEARVMSDGVETNTNSDRSDEEDEVHLGGAAAAGQFEFGEYPPRVRWLQERDHHLAKPAAPPATAAVNVKRARNEKTITVLPVAARSSSSEQQQTRIPHPRSGPRRKGAGRSRRGPTPGEDPSDTAAGMTSCGGDGSKRRRCSDSDSESVILRPVTVGLGGRMCLVDERLPANANTSVGIAVPCRGLVVAPPVTGRVSEACPLGPGPRRSPRLRIGRER
jgi:hypothetical protein